MEENEKMGKIFAEKANASKAPVAFLIPLGGVSMLDADGQPFWDPEADRAMFDAIKSNVQKGIPVVEMNNNINDPEFAAKAVEKSSNFLMPQPPHFFGKFRSTHLTHANILPVYFPFQRNL